jgi:hypothetical protein
MLIVFIEPVPRGRPKREPIAAFAVETRAGTVLKTLVTLEEAINWAKAGGFTVHVAQVRNTDKGNPDHWRKA